MILCRPPHVARRSFNPSGLAFEGVLSILFRARSQKLVMLEVAALSLRFLHYRVPATIGLGHSALLFKAGDGAQMDRTALRGCVGARPRPAVRGGACTLSVCFDNFTIKAGYGSYATIDKQGERFDMTNWASVSLPASAVPRDLSFTMMLGSGGIFRDGLSLSAFVHSFSVIAPDVVANQRRRS